MKIIVADDEELMLENMISILREIDSENENQINGFCSPSKLLDYAKDNPADVAFLDIEMGAFSGVEIAKQLKIWYPQINIVFVTSYEEYMKSAIQLRVSGYVLKPVKKEDIAEELRYLRYPVIPNEDKDILYVKCFGNFEVYYNNKPLNFARSKSKELFAYLIDRRGSCVSSGELCAVLWENNFDDSRRNKNYLQVLKKDLINTLREVNMEDVFIYSWNRYGVDTDKIKCDYYDFLNDKPEGIRAYNGEYMSQYSWGELKSAVLENKVKNKNS